MEFCLHRTCAPQHGGTGHGVQSMGHRAECAGGAASVSGLTRKPLAPGSRLPRCGTHAMYHITGLQLSPSLASYCTIQLSFSVPWPWRACPIWNILSRSCQQLQGSGWPSPHSSSNWVRTGNKPDKPLNITILPHPRWTWCLDLETYPDRLSRDEDKSHQHQFSKHP